MRHTAALVAALLVPGGTRAVPPGMAMIPAGAYMPLHPAHPGASVMVGAFALDRLPVTRGQFMAFMRTHSEWRNGTAEREDPQRPAVSVSWFAAKAFCEAQGKRLPTTAEWELAAAASATRRDATSDPAFVRHVLELYSARTSSGARRVGRGERNLFGVADLHELVWEWTLDFDGPVSAGMPGHQNLQHHDAACAGAAIGATNAGNYPAFLRDALRSGLTRRSTTRNLGFRCAAGLAS